jgi:hypothetical protein
MYAIIQAFSWKFMLWRPAFNFKTVNDGIVMNKFEPELLSANFHSSNPLYELAILG